MSVTAPGAARRAKTKKSTAAPKSFKRDGTPKKRWTAAERSERGHPKRTSGGQRAARTAGSDPVRDSRPDRFSQDRPERSRPERFSQERPDRPRPERSRPDRQDRPRYDRQDRPRYDRQDRSRTDRPRADLDTMSWTAREIVVDAATVVDAQNGFAQLGVPKTLVAVLQAEGITAPFPIQSATIPDAMRGRDVLGRGQTGSGKTLGFGLPMVSTLAGATSKTPRGIVLVPTRELARQVADVLAPLARTMSMSVTLVAGGMAYTPQIRAFERGVDIVVATPGRLIDLMEQGAVDLSRIEVAVLDEADHMADLGFMPAVTTILDAIPAGGQRMLFSATLDAAVDRLVRKYLTDPVTHQVDSARATVSTMDHHLIHVLPHDKNALTAEIAGRDGRTVVFVRTQRGADRVADQLRSTGVMAGSLHGGLTQGARTRIMAAFKGGQVPVLVATDVAARGIHVDDVGLVLQVDPPGGPKEYLHRAGRTARAGGTGIVVTLALPHQRRDLTRLTSQAGVKSQPLEVRPGDRALTAALGARQPSGVAVSPGEYQKLIAPAQRGGGGTRPRQRKDFSRPRRR